MFDIASPPDRTNHVSAFSAPERPAADRDLQRAEGSGLIVLGGYAQGRRILDLFQRAPVRIMFPSVGGGAVEEAVLVNTAGGMAGGDRLEFAATALAGAAVAVTTQAAEKVYRALNEPARIATRLQASEAAKLAWLPQETIVFNRARLCRTTEIDVASGAELLALEWLALGRTAYCEVLQGGHISDSWRVKRDGRLIWADGFRASDSVFSQLHRKALLADCRAVAMLVYFGPRPDARLQLLRDIAPSLECHCAATSVGGLIIARFAARVSCDLRLALGSLLRQFGDELGPSPFRVPKMWSC